MLLLIGYEAKVLNPPVGKKPTGEFFQQLTNQPNSFKIIISFSYLLGLGPYGLIVPWVFLFLLLAVHANHLGVEHGHDRDPGFAFTSFAHKLYLIGYKAKVLNPPVEKNPTGGFF